MQIGDHINLIQRRTGFYYEVKIVRILADRGYVGLTLNDSALWSAGAQILIDNFDIIFPMEAFDEAG
jgi:hypothetical protein